MNKDFNHLVATFRSSIKTWDYFVNWNKVFMNRAEVEIALNKLNYLLGKEDLRNEFRTLYTLKPDIAKALPVLLAIRENKLEIYDKTTKESEFYGFATGKESADKYFTFLEKTKLINLFRRDGIKNIADYVTGVKVGLDSNGRKNRGGFLMENIVGLFLADFCRQNQLDCLPQARPAIIKSQWGD